MAMKEKLYTMELNDALAAGDECCFCWLERKVEQENLDFVLGASYMERDIRDKTDRGGFCRHHTKMMYDYGNTLGNAWILKSRLEYLNRHLKEAMSQYAPKKSSVFLKRKKDGEGNAVSDWIGGQEGSCYICDRIGTIYERVLDTFVRQLQKDPAFGERLMNGKGFCIHHFGAVCRACEAGMTEAEKSVWMPKLFSLMEKNLDRIQGDIDWLIEKFDYRNQDADWKESKDAVQRTMQKIKGGYPADPVYSKASWK